jgi:hypothetical protein
MGIIRLLLILIAVVGGATTLPAQLNGSGSARVPRRQTYPLTHLRVVLDGDSMTSRNGDAITDSEPNVGTYVRLMFGTGAGVTNVAVSDQDSGDMLSDAVSQVDALFDSSKTNVCFAMIGSNDWHLDSTPVGTAWQNYSNYLWGRKAAGFRVVACTMPPVGQSPPATAGFNTNFNNFVRAHWATVAHTLCDLAAEPRFANYADTTYYADNFHFNDTGIRIYAEYVRVGIIRAVWGGL